MEEQFSFELGNLSQFSEDYWRKKVSTVPFEESGIRNYSRLFLRPVLSFVAEGASAGKSRRWRLGSL